MSDASVTSATGAPEAEALWLTLVIDALQELRPAYHPNPSGDIKLNRVVARFQWDRINNQFYANLMDAQSSFGSIVGGIISGIDPNAQSIPEAAESIDLQFNHYLSRLRSRDTGRLL